jgi:hypothetical protein
VVMIRNNNNTITSQDEIIVLKMITYIGKIFVGVKISVNDFQSSSKDK